MKASDIIYDCLRRAWAKDVISDQEMEKASNWLWDCIEHVTEEDDDD